jgi:hypothetical protein
MESAIIVLFSIPLSDNLPMSVMHSDRDFRCNDQPRGRLAISFFE